jgi:hypothetical protein
VIPLPDFANRLQPFLLGHDDVADDGVRHRCAELVPARLAVQRKVHAMTYELEGPAHEFDEQDVIIDDENAGHGRLLEAVNWRKNARGPVEVALIGVETPWPGQPESRKNTGESFIM